MKIKSIIACGLLLLGVGAATTSCEDMMTPDNKLVTTDFAPQDTLYQMMGIIKRMQKLADRTVLLGEVRADLVDVDQAHSSADIKELGNNDVSTTNVYNSPADYYAVINNCNIYLAYVDSLFQVYGDYYYRKEVIAAKCFRAWCYLELAKIYGAVPFFTHPILTPDAAESALAQPKADMLTILDFAIGDLADYAKTESENGTVRPSYGYTWNNTFSGRSLFIPFRVMLAELYLWRGSYKGKAAGKEDFINAVRMYHDYLTYPGEEKSVEYDACEWYSNEWKQLSGQMNYGDHYSARSKEDYYAGVLPLDTAAYFGYTTDLRAIFNSTISNYYYPALVPSARMSNISKAQDYTFLTYKMGTGVAGDTVLAYAKKDAAALGGERRVGDLRLNAIYIDRSNVSESKYNAKVNSVKQYIVKWTEGNTSLSNDNRQRYIFYYTTNMLYLHMAEALNLAGYPETAMAVLTHGLSYETLNTSYYLIHNKQSSTGADTTIQVRVVSDAEFDDLCKIKTYGYTNTTSDFDDDADKAARANNSFVVWKSTVFTPLNKFGWYRTLGTEGRWSTVYRSVDRIQIGIHSLGSGDTENNEHYRLLNPNDNTKTGGISFVDIINNLKQGGIRPAAPIGWAPGATVLSFDDWKNHPDNKLSPTQKTTANYNKYVDSYNVYPKRVADYKSDSTYLRSPAVLDKCQERVRWLILEEEALEGSFEGNRFYDILRHQMQSGKVGGVGSTITMPDSIVKLYGATPNMEGKPWYIKLPER
ncbi:MAG: RagB/SusD family nutrient uptake outer membrane protein [Bacteroidaceae bacterium]|nr:RagB/SusD family nutrient uptake outer membrane protein [Bacteroidaceae bacterium]